MRITRSFWRTATVLTYGPNEMMEWQARQAMKATWPGNIDSELFLKVLYASNFVILSYLSSSNAIFLLFFLQLMMEPTQLNPQAQEAAEAPSMQKLDLLPHRTTPASIRPAQNAPGPSQSQRAPLCSTLTTSAWSPTVDVLMTLSKWVTDFQLWHLVDINDRWAWIKSCIVQICSFGSTSNCHWPHQIESGISLYLYFTLIVTDKCIFPCYAVLWGIDADCHSVWFW